MQTIGTQLQQPPLVNPTKLADLIWYEGPLLSLFVEGDEYYLYNLVDGDSAANRWLVFPVDEKSLREYIGVTKETTLYQLIVNAGKWFLVDIDNNIDVIASYEIKNFNDLFEEYLPSEDSYCNFEPLIHDENFKTLLTSVGDDEQN